MVSSPLKNISELGWLFHIYGKIKNVPNHQPVYIYTHKHTLYSIRTYLSITPVYRHLQLSVFRRESFPTSNGAALGFTNGRLNLVKNKWPGFLYDETCYSWLVVSNTLKNMKVNWDHSSQYMEKINTDVPICLDDGFFSYVSSRHSGVSLPPARLLA